MQHILVYADSLSWGIVPTARKRLLFEQRWPGVMEMALGAAGLDAAYRTVCEEAGCHIFDAGSVAPSSEVDGVHLDLAQHAARGKALAEAVKTLLSVDAP